MTAKDLKNALLQEAVQGKLVPQIASEGNAKDLLEEIRKEKGESIPLASKPSRSTNRSCKQADSLRFVGLSATPSAGSNAARNARFEPISEDEIPFEIPETWCWCRLGEIVEKLTDGSHNPPPAKTSGYPVISAMNIKNGKITLDNVNRYTDQTGFDKENPRTNITSGDIILGIIGGSIGNIAIYDLTEKVIAQRSIAIINTAVSNIFISLLLQSPYIQSQLQDSKGTAQGGVYLGSLRNLLIPLPPLAEQKRIVAAIEKFMPLIEEYGKKETELKALNEQIGTLTKKAILQEAVQGKLVPQISAEGNAKDLLEEIKKEKAKLIKEGKIKKEKPLPEITEDEIPFDIPENWCWCKVEDITIPIGNKNNQIQTKEILKKGKIPVVSQGQSLIDGYSNETEKTIKDIPVIMFGDHTRNVKYIDFPFVIGADGTKFLKPIICNEHYIYYLILFISIKLRNRGYARHYSLLKEEWLPLPPLAEQKRIVSAIEKLLPLCEKLGE